MIERRSDWPTIRAGVEDVLRSADPSQHPPRQLVEDMLHDRYRKRNLEITEEDILYTTGCMTHSARFYLANLSRQESRVPPKTARSRMRTVSRLAQALAEAIVTLDDPNKADALHDMYDEVEKTPQSEAHVARLLDAALAVRQGNAQAQLLLEPTDPGADQIKALEIGLAVAEMKVTSELVERLGDLHVAAGVAAKLPLGESEFPIWPMYRNPLLTLRAVECVVDEMATMFAMLLGELLSGSRDRNYRDHGPLVAPLTMFFKWVKETTGRQPPKPIVLETAMLRLPKTPLSLVSSRFRGPPYESGRRGTKSQV